MTGAEALQKIMETMDELKTTVNELKVSIQLIESNIKTLNNRAAGLLVSKDKELVQTSQIPVTKTISTTAISAGVPTQKSQGNIQSGPSRGRQLFEMIEEHKEEPLSIRESNSPGVLTYKKVYGKLLSNTEEPLESVLIKVYDRNNEVCATTETDPIGYWETMLKPGRYVAEYTKTGFKTTNKTFEVGKNSREVEVK